MAPVDVAASCGAYFCPITVAHATITIIAITNTIIAPLLLKIFSIVAPAISHAAKNALFNISAS